MGLFDFNKVLENVKHYTQTNDFKKKIGIIKIASAATFMLLNNESIEVIDPDNSGMEMQDLDKVAASNMFSLVENEEGEIEVRRNSDGMCFFTFDKKDSTNEYYDNVVSIDEFKQTHGLLSKHIAIMNGEVYTEVFDEKTQSPIEFLPIESTGRTALNQVSGAGEFISLLNTLSGNRLFVADREDDGKDIIYRLYDEDENRYVEGTGFEILTETLQKFGLTKKEINDYFKVDSASLKEEKVDVDELAIQDAKYNYRKVYTNDSINSCMKVRNKDGSYKLVVEDSLGMGEVTTDATIDLILDQIKGLDIDSTLRDDLVDEAAKLLVQDQNVTRDDILKFYDFVLLQNHPKHREKFMNKLNRETKTRVQRVLINGGIDRETLKEMDADEQIDIFRDVMEAKAAEIIDKKFSGTQTAKDEKVLEELLRDHAMIKLSKLYYDIDGAERNVENQKAEEAKQEKETLKALKQEAKEAGATEYIKLVVDDEEYSASNSKSRVNGQERLIFTDDGKAALVTEVVKQKRAYNLSEEAEEERQEQVKVRREAKSKAQDIEGQLSFEDFFTSEEDIEDLVSSDELENVVTEVEADQTELVARYDSREMDAFDQDDDFDI
ncbi:MAG: hypothetical protein MJ245_06995 [Clostridia bacterium]|nr:hypothetical protein [Clostridia bacterium]